MALDLDTLFSRLGKLGSVLFECNTFQATTLATEVDELIAEYDTNPELVSDVPQAELDAQDNITSIMTKMQEIAEETVIETVRDDVPAKANSLADALGEVRLQMISQADTVKACTITASAAALSTNSGNGAIVVTTKRGDGLVQENSVAEVLKVLCTADSQSGGATSGQEQFTITGGEAPSSPWGHDWPTASGANETLNVIDASLDADGNLLTNSDFEAFTANLPDNWVAQAGVAGTNFLKSLAQQYNGSSSLQIVGGATTVTLSQTFDSASGTDSELEPQTSYAVHAKVKVDVVPVAGVLTIELVDGSDTVINDDQSVANSFTQSVPALTTSWASISGVFRLPKALPSAIKIRIRVSTAISSGTNLFIDDLAMGQVTACYAGGPGICIFKGSSKFVFNDGWNLTVTNDRGTADYAATFQSLFDRFFDMKSLNLLLPSAATPTQGNSLIQA